MCLLFETIRIENGVPMHLAWHERRMNNARDEYWPGSDRVELTDQFVVPPEFSTGIVRCNISYCREIRDVTFKPYSKRVIRSLKLVQDNTLDYHVKYHDRKALENLLALRDNCDDILIVQNGLITDTSFSNIIFFDGTTWYTPKKPLLKGTCRERLLEEGAITAADIPANDLHGFIGCKLINAMRFPEEEEIIMISSACFSQQNARRKS